MKNQRKLVYYQEGGGCYEIFKEIISYGLLAA